MQTLNWPSKKAYEDRLFGSHDFSIDVDILNFDEEVIGSARFLDGQINLQDNTNLIRRTCDLTISDPAGALDFSTSSAWTGTSVWVDRLIRVRHTIDVAGHDVTATAFIGPPASLSRSGAEVAVSCQDKAALAMRGAIPYTVKTGANAVAAIRAILSQCVGEFRFRFPSSTKRLSRDYSVGLDDAAAPMVVAARIARLELGMQLLYAADGYALLRTLPQSSSLTVPNVTEPASSAVDFTTFNNYVRGTGKATTKKTGSVTIKTQPIAVAQIVASSNLSPQGLARKGVPILKPLVISDDAWTTTAQVKDAVVRQLEASDRLETSTDFSCVPFFHADSDDLTTLKIGTGKTTVRLQTGSIPLGVAGDMSIGTQRIVSRQPAHKSRVSKLRWKRYVTGPKKHRKTHWKRI